MGANLLGTPGRTSSEDANVDAEYGEEDGNKA